MPSQSEPEPRPLAEVVGRNCKRIRKAADVTQDELAWYASEIGLRWDAAKVGRFEAGAVAPTFATVLAVALALSNAQQAKRRAGGGGSVTLAELAQFDGDLVLTPDGPDVPGDVIADLCRGRPYRLRPKLPGGSDQVDPKLVKQFVKTVKTVSDLAHVRQRSGLAEYRLAQRIGISRDELAIASFQLWRSTFTEERDRRAGPNANQQKRGRVSRELRAELEKALADGKD